MVDMVWGHAVVVAWIFAFLICVAVIEASAALPDEGRLLRIEPKARHVRVAVLFVGASVAMVLAVGLGWPTIFMPLR
jgi:hypothetical protein